MDPQSPLGTRLCSLLRLVDTAPCHVLGAHRSQAEFEMPLPIEGAPLHLSIVSSSRILILDMYRYFCGRKAPHSGLDRCSSETSCLATVTCRLNVCLVSCGWPQFLHDAQVISTCGKNTACLGELELDQIPSFSQYAFISMRCYLYGEGSTT